MISGIQIGSLVRWQCGERLREEHGIILKRYKAKDLMILYKDLLEADDEWWANLVYNIDGGVIEEFFTCYLTLVAT